jgi:hypothetical protein
MSERALQKQGDLKMLTTPAEEAVRANGPTSTIRIANGSGDHEVTDKVADADGQAKPATKHPRHPRMTKLEAEVSRRAIRAIVHVSRPAMVRQAYIDAAMQWAIAKHVPPYELTRMKKIAAGEIGRILRNIQARAERRGR